MRDYWTLADYRIPIPDDGLPTLEQQNDIDIAETRAQQYENRVKTSLSLLNTNHRQNFDEMVRAIMLVETVSALLEEDSSTAAAPSAQTKSSRLFSLDAPGGINRIFVLRAIQEFFRTRSKQVTAVAMSAVAAVLLDGGRTAHSVFKISVPVSTKRACSFSANSNTSRALQQVYIIIWDDIVMCHRHSIERPSTAPFAN